MHVRTCTDAPIALSKPHIISVSVNVTNLSTISSAVPKDIEARYARAHVHSELTPHGHGRVEAT